MDSVTQPVPLWKLERYPYAIKLQSGLRLIRFNGKCGHKSMVDGSDGLKFEVLLLAVRTQGLLCATNDIVIAKACKLTLIGRT